MNGRIINNLRFAGDIAVLAEKKVDLQGKISRIANESTRMDMKINTGNTEVQHIGVPKINAAITIDQDELKQVEEFVYLGGNMSEDATTTQDLKRRVGLACGAMQSLNPIWKAKDIRISTKIRVYDALVLSILMYNSETWTLREADKNRLRVFEMNCLRKIKGVTRRDRIRNADIRSEMGMEVDVVQKIQKKRLRYYGHVVRMKPERLPNIALFGHVHGQRKRGRPRKRWLNNLEEDAEEMGLNMVESSYFLRDLKGPLIPKSIFINFRLVLGHMTCNSATPKSAE